MQAIEIETEIDENHEIHLRLPDKVRTRKARVLVIYDETPAPSERKAARPVKLGLFRDQMEISDDFDEPLPDEFWLSGKP